MSITIELGHLPDPDLSPNKRLHWGELYRARRAAKDEAIYLVKALPSRPRCPISRAHITITWTSRTRRRRDVDNMFSSMKPTIDGLGESGLIADDSAMHVSYTLRYELGETDNTVILVEERDGTDPRQSDV